MSRTYRRALFVGGLAIAIAIVIAVVPGHRGWFDVGVYHGAVNYWLHGEGELYNYIRPNSTYGFTYPPFAAVCMAPMALVGWYPAIAINAAMTVVAASFTLYLLVDPIARRAGWSRWYAFALAACLFAMLAPVRDTVSFGQINLLLVALVYADLWLLEHRWHRLAGVGIGLAAAIKLTPAIFIVYLLVTKRWRAAGIATGTAAGATLLAAAVAPDTSRTYFTDLVWDTDRIGEVEYISNQSLLGLVARLSPQSPSRLMWIVLIAVVLVVWVARVRSAARRGDDRAGFALTGLAGCLISPITWVHHLVWLVPGLVVLAGTVFPRSSADARARYRLWAGVGAYVLLASSLVWLWPQANGVLGFLGGNSYVLITFGMLVFLSTAQALVHGEESPDRRIPAEAFGLGPGPSAPHRLRLGEQLQHSRREVLADHGDARRLDDGG